MDFKEQVDIAFGLTDCTRDEAYIRNLKNRYKENTVKENDCLIWQKSRHLNGYGRWSTTIIKGDYAHRVSYKLFNGDIPDGLHVCHSCDVPACVNPEHLWLGTALDNAVDRDNKGRGRWSKS